jgi:adenosylcobinamide kinase/adenosylcobinamide-phosphate guanylyltransferase
MITLVTGGARSGKTRYALAHAGTGTPKTYIATAELLDAEMQLRAEHHRAERGAEWQTIEEPYRIDEAIERLHGTVIVDCLTLWLSNWMLRDERLVKPEVERLRGALRDTQADVLLITNEVGSSIVPEIDLARRFRDAAGFLNQRIAETADHVVLMVCGIPIQVK